MSNFDFNNGFSLVSTIDIGWSASGKDESDLNYLLEQIVNTLQQQVNSKQPEPITAKRLFRRNVTLATTSKKYYWQHSEDVTTDRSLVDLNEKASDDQKIKHSTKSKKVKSSRLESKDLQKNGATCNATEENQIDHLISQIKYKELLFRTNDEFLNYLDKSVDDMESKMKELDQQIKNGYKELNSSWDMVMQSYNKSKLRRRTADSRLTILPLYSEKIPDDLLDFSKMISNLVTPSHEMKQNDDGSLPLTIQKAGDENLEPVMINEYVRKIRSSNKKGKSKKTRSRKKKPFVKQSGDEPTKAIEVFDDEEIAGVEDEVEGDALKAENDDDDMEEEEAAAAVEMAKVEKYPSKVHKKLKASSGNGENEIDDEDDDDENDEDTESSSQSFGDVLLSSLKKFIPFRRKSRNGYVESSLPLDIAYRLTDDMEPKLAHVTISVKDEVSTLKYEQ